MQRPGTPTDLPHGGHETRDVNIRGVLGLAFAIAAATGVVQLGLWVLLREYQQEAKRDDPQLSPLRAERQPPPPPRLQNAPNVDYAEFRRSQEAQLQSYGWVDRKAKRVRIPIARAMDLLAERGLPTPRGSTEPQSQEREPERKPGAKQKTESKGKKD